jgi:NADPH:quinone reductase
MFGVFKTRCSDRSWDSAQRMRTKRLLRRCLSRPPKGDARESERGRLGEYESMWALVANGIGSAALMEVPEPVRGRDQTIVGVHVSSLNRGEMTRLQSAPKGWRPGWDIAGVVIDAGDGGLPVGTRVVGIALGEAWAQRVAVASNWLAPLSDDVSFANAAALPTAGLAALRMLRLGGGTLGRRIAITGAAGGVGRLAVQLAHLGGAHVTAIVGRPERAAGLQNLGADQIVVDLSELGPVFDLILESAGGDSLARLATMLDVEGTLVVFGNSSNQPTVFPDIRSFYLGGARRLQSFTVFHNLAADPPCRDLGYLAGLVHRDVLRPNVDVEISWSELDRALALLADRSVQGKIVLKIH